MKRRAAGSVTLFYAGIFLSFAGLFGALLESVRVQTTRGMATDSAYLAIQNVLTEYQRELWEDYHLLFYDQDELGGEAGIEERLNRNMAVSWNPVSAGSALPVFSENDWLRVRCSCDGTAAISGMTERQGLAVGEQITAYMKYQTATETVKFLLEQTGLLRGLTDGKKMISEKLKLEESFSGLEEEEKYSAETVREYEADLG